MWKFIHFILFSSLLAIVFSATVNAQDFIEFVSATYKVDNLASVSDGTNPESVEGNNDTDKTLAVGDLPFNELSEADIRHSTTHEFGGASAVAVTSGQILLESSGRVYASLVTDGVGSSSDGYEMSTTSTGRIELTFRLNPTEDNYQAFDLFPTTFMANTESGSNQVGLISASIKIGSVMRESMQTGTGQKSSGERKGDDPPPTFDPIRLGLGTHTIIAEVSSENSGAGSGSVGTASAQATLDCYLSPVEDGGEGETESEIFWESGSGNFNADFNWQPMQVPGANHAAIFDRDATYTVTMGGESAGKAIIERGTVTFSSGSFGLVLGNEEAPSLIVGRNTLGTARLTLDSHTLSPLHAALGLNANRTGIITVKDASNFNSQGRLYVGVEGTGTLTIKDGGHVSAAETLLGLEGGSIGTANVESAPSFAAGSPSETPTVSWQTGSIAVGDEGTGVVNLGDAYILSNIVVMASSSDASVTVTVTDGLWNFGGDSVIGADGTATLSVAGSGAGFHGESNEALPSHRMRAPWRPSR